MSARLLDFIDFDRSYINSDVMEKEQALCDLIANECGTIEVNKTQECLNDVKESEKRN